MSCAGVEQDHPDLPASRLRKLRAAARTKSFELGHRLDAREPAAGDDERQEARRISGSRSMSASSRAWMTWFRRASASPST